MSRSCRRARLDEVIREAVDAGVIVVAGRGYEFRHALVREAVADQLLPGESARVHSGYAESLEARPGEPAQRAARAVRISSHWLEAHVLDRAFRSSLEGMRLSRSAFAHVDGRPARRTCARRCGTASPTPMSPASATSSCSTSSPARWRSAGEPHRALATIEQALAEIDPADIPGRARLLRNKALMIDAEGRADSLGLFEQALELLDEGDVDDPTLRAGILAEAASKYMVSGRSERAIAAATEALELAPDTANRIRSVAANVRAGTLTHLGFIDEGAQDYARALQEAGDDRDALLRYHVNYSDTLHLLGRYRESMEVALAGIRIAEEAGVARTSGAILALNTVDPLFALGDWDRADDTHRRLARPRSACGLPRVSAAREDPLRGVAWRPRAGEHACSCDGGARSRISRSSRIRWLPDSPATSPRSTWREAISTPRGRRRASCWVAERLASPPWELPIAPVVARIIARRREASGDPLLQQQDAERLRAVIERDDWPTRPLWAAFAAAELGGPSGAGDDVGLWRAALDLAAAPGAEALTRLQLRWGLARAEVRQGDRVAAAETLGALRARRGTTSARRSSSAWVDHLVRDAGLGAARDRHPATTPTANR